MDAIARWALGLLVVGCAGRQPRHLEPAGAGTADGNQQGQELERKAEPEPGPDQTSGEIAQGWNATVLLDNADVGIWTVRSYSLYEQFGCPEVIGLDDQGRCHVLVGYSGNWSATQIVHDHRWLGGMDHADVDPRVAGAELYVGGEKGNLYQVLAYPEGVLDARRIAHLPGREIHTIVCLAGPGGGEVLAFTNPGALVRIRPAPAGSCFTVERVEELPGRVRDAVILPGSSPPEIATVSRAGRLEILRMEATGPVWRTIHQADMGMGRLALRAGGDVNPRVLYSTLDDGRVLRHEEATPDRWNSEVIYLGPQGARGIVSGRFTADPDVETVAVFGYSSKVELLSLRGGRWSCETLFVDRDRGHWLAVAELDGRNTTDEILASGYGARIVMLARTPGYGFPDSIPRATTP